STPTSFSSRIVSVRPSRPKVSLSSPYSPASADVLAHTSADTTRLDSRFPMGDDYSQCRLYSPRPRPTTCRRDGRRALQRGGRRSWPPRPPLHGHADRWGSNETTLTVPTCLFRDPITA